MTTSAPRGMIRLMPELPEVEAVRRRLEPAMRGARIIDVLLKRKNLRRPFPRAFASRLKGRRIRSVDRRGKYLLVALDSGDTLLMHLGMSGLFRINRDSKHRTATAEATGELHDHVVFTLSNGVTVTFNDPRRFGVMDLLVMALPPTRCSRRWGQSPWRRPSAPPHWRGR